MKYVADDGTEFVTEQACLDYEAAQKTAEEEKAALKEQIVKEIDESTNRINNLLTEFYTKYPEELETGSYTGFCLHYKA